MISWNMRLILLHGELEKEEAHPTRMFFHLSFCQNLWNVAKTHWQTDAIVFF